MPSRRSLRFLSLLFPLLVAAGCGSSGDGTGPEPEPPVITVSGVSNGEVVGGPVTIDITVDRGTFAATLDGAPFFSGSTVEEAGAHVLQVEASNQGATSSLTVAFEIRFAVESVLVIRLFDLGDNDAGGGGDAILLTDSSSAGMEHFMIDAGPAGPGGADRDFVAGRLEALGVTTLEALLLTHAHTDHFLGMTDVLEAVDVEDFLYNGQTRTLSSYTDLLTVANAQAGDTVVVSQELEYEVGVGEGPTQLTVIPPLATHLGNANAGSSELNDGSLGTALTKGAFTMFFTGDGEVDANARWRQSFASVTTTVTALKVGHHGANDAVFDNGFSGTATWLDHTDAELQVVSANGRSHPRQNATTALLAAEPRTYCTSVHGDIEIRVAPGLGPGGRGWDVTVERKEGEDCVPGTDATT